MLRATSVYNKLYLVCYLVSVRISRCVIRTVILVEVNLCDIEL